MARTQLRRYEIRSGEMGEFVSWWQGISEVRERYGFRIEFAFVDDSTNEFVWALSHDGDFEAAEKVYFESPERAALFVGIPQRVEVQHVTMVEVIRGPSSER